MRIANRGLTICALLFIFFCNPAMGWEIHSAITYFSFINDKEMQGLPDIEAEPLQDFLEKEKTGLVDVLRQEEEWAKANIVAYPALPEKLSFKAHTKAKHLLTQDFLYAIRVNADMPFPLYLNQLNQGGLNQIPRASVILPLLSQDVTIRTLQLIPLKPKQKVSPLAVLSTAADEPDYGMDINLWEDNPGRFGKLYAFGKQPFGIPGLAINSQSPFHLGFYHEPKIVYFLASFLKKCYPEYRIHLYFTLSDFAFKKNHPYWGWRFLGWGLHYVQDLFQPYHSTLFPGVSLKKQLGIYFLDKIGLKSSLNHLLTINTNKHFAFENFTTFALLDNNDANQNRWIKALAGLRQPPLNQVNFKFSAVRNVISKYSYDKSADIETLISQSFPAFVLDFNYRFYQTDPAINVFKLANQLNAPEKKDLDLELADLMAMMGNYTRGVARLGLKHERFS